MKFNIIIDSKKTFNGFVGNKLSANLPETLFFSREQGEIWEMALVSMWYNYKPALPIYVHCSMIQTQIVGDKFEKCLFVLLPPLAKDPTVISSYHQYKVIFEPHVSVIDFSFHHSEGQEIVFPSKAHMIFNLEIRKV